MAIARGAGTEIIRSSLHQEIDNSAQIIIFGVQHHVYTVLSVVAMGLDVATDQNFLRMYLTGYDSVAGLSAQNFHIFQQDFSDLDTFVWNDKFSFNGHEPVDFTADLDSVVKQDAIADQGSAVPQYLFLLAEAAADNFDVMCTFIDQNNA